MQLHWSMTLLWAPKCSGRTTIYVMCRRLKPSSIQASEKKRSSGNEWDRQAPIRRRRTELHNKPHSQSNTTMLCTNNDREILKKNRSWKKPSLQHFQTDIRSLKTYAKLNGIYKVLKNVLLVQISPGARLTKPGHWSLTQFFTFYSKTLM